MLSISRGISNVLTKIALSSSRTTATQQLSAFHTSRSLNCEPAKEAANSEAEERRERELSEAELKRLQKDRTKLIPVETSIRYLKSAAYKQTYGDQFVWEQYRRNHKGLFPPKKTRKTCIRQGVIASGNPCPICRDEYLVLDHHNIELLRQFISPQTGEVLSYSKTGLCQKKHFELLVAVERAMDYGLLTFDVPFREYNYSEYYGNEAADSKKVQA